MAILTVCLASTVASSPGVTLGIRDTAFTLDGQPTFLLGISYYGALGADEATICRDLDRMTEHGFNWLRVWATWTAYDNDVSALEDDGSPREPYLSRLKRLVELANERRMVVDVTLTRGAKYRDRESHLWGKLPSLDAHLRAVTTLADALRPYRNVYMDIANERNIRDERFVSYAELAVLRDAIKEVDADRLVTASHAGGDLTVADIVEYVRAARVDFLSPHRPRHVDSPAETRAKTIEHLDQIRASGTTMPLHYQEPFRRGYAPNAWEPKASDFMDDLCNARDAGAAGWCLHNGDTRDGNPDRRPRRSFDLRDGSLFDQLDGEEREFLRWLRSER
jgi:hypothetical protein